MENVLKLDRVEQYNDLVHYPTLHPLVSVIDFSEVRPIRSSLRSFGVYAIFLKDVKCGDMIYGRQTYDYQEGTLVCLAPGQVFGAKDDGQLRQPKGWALLFHPDLLRGTQLGRNIRNYTFFSYEVREALHLSEQERRTILDCLHNIRHELQHAIDRHSRTLVVNNIEMFLNYCVRFYDRQFCTRSKVNSDVLHKFEHELNDYFRSGSAQRQGLPSVRYFADKQSEINGLPTVRFSSEALTFLQKLPYPGNIRELKNLVERTILVSGKAVLEASDFESQCFHTMLSAKAEAASSLEGLTLDELEKQTILQALKTHAGNLSHVATALGISRAALYRRLEKYDIPVDK